MYHSICNCMYIDGIVDQLDLTKLYKPDSLQTWHKIKCKQHSETSLGVKPLNSTQEKTAFDSKCNSFAANSL